MHSANLLKERDPGRISAPPLRGPGLHPSMQYIKRPGHTFMDIARMARNAVTRTSNAFERTTDVGSKQKRVVEHGRTETPGAAKHNRSGAAGLGEGAKRDVTLSFLPGLTQTCDDERLQSFSSISRRTMRAFSFYPRKKPISIVFVLVIFCHGSIRIIYSNALSIHGVVYTPKNRIL